MLFTAEACSTIGSIQLVRNIGKWSLAGLVINAIIGSSIFGLPSELTRLLGGASTIAVALGGLAAAVMVACAAEVSSQFSTSGGAYLYARETFGTFVGIQVGWFSWLSRVASPAAAIALFGNYFVGLIPEMANWRGRALAMAVVMCVLVALNYVGVKSGAGISSAAVAARLIPLGLLIAFATPLIWRQSSAREIMNLSGHSAANWFEALLLISFFYGGYETGLMSLAEVKNPRKSAPFALGIALLTCIVLYTLCQQLVVVTIGAKTTDRPMAEAAEQILGQAGFWLISIAALVSTVGYLSSAVLNVPRLMFSLSEHGDFPRWFSTVHPRFRTPYIALVVFGVLVYAMAVTGGFRWAVAVSAGARMITYGSVCAALIPLRHRNKLVDAFRIPLGRLLSVLGVAMALVLVAKLQLREAIVLLITAAIAVVNW